MTDAKKITTTDNGAPAASDEHSQSVGADGPIVLHDHKLVEKLANFNREKVPERIVHAKGGGAFGTFTVTQDTIDNERDMLKAFLVAEIKGWTDAVKSPEQSAKYAVEKYGKDQDLDVEEQTAEAEAQNTLILTEDVNANGLFTMTDELVAENIASLKAMGTDVSADDLFDLSLIKEVYEENPDLVTTFTIPTA